MISAKEAIVLYNESGAEATNYLRDKIEPIIIAAAKSGKCECIIFIDNISVFDNLYSKITPLENLVVEKLKALGYQAKIDRDGETYVPRGLADDEGNGPLYVNYAFHISWIVQQ